LNNKEFFKLYVKLKSDESHLEKMRQNRKGRVKKLKGAKAFLKSQEGKNFKKT